MPSHSARARSSSSSASSPRSASTRSQRRRVPRAAPPRARPRPAAPPLRAAAPRSRRATSASLALNRACRSASGASGVASVERPPLLDRLVELRSASVVPGALGDARRAGPARRSPALLPLSSAASPRRFRLVHGSCTMARARLATDLFFARPATPSSSARRSASDAVASAARSSAADAGVLVVGLGRDVQELRLVRSRAPPPRARSGRRRRGAPRCASTFAS